MPIFHYPNDHVFKFCQNCGYVRRRGHTADPRVASFDLPAIDLRNSSLQSATLSSASSRQKQSLKAELEGFLYALPGNKSLFDTTPLDVCRFFGFQGLKR